MKIKTTIVVTIGIILIVMSIGCAPGVDVRPDIVDALTQLSEVGIERIDSDLMKIEEELYKIEIEILQLQAVVISAKEWIAYQEGRMEQEWEAEKVRSWIIEVPTVGLQRFKNEHYYLTDLSFSVSQFGTPIERTKSVLKIADSTSKIPRDWEYFDKELNTRKESFELQRDRKLAEKLTSASAFMNCIAHWEDWEISEIDEVRYHVSGPALGWAREISNGSCTYYADTGELKPADSAGQTLQKMLIAE